MTDSSTEFGKFSKNPWTFFVKMLKLVGYDQH